MAIYLPGAVEEERIALDELTPREIVAELDKYVVGQKAAKRAVAIALRNRMRRQKLAPELAEEIIPKNIIMIGPTGVGKTEIATLNQWCATWSRSRSTWYVKRSWKTWPTRPS